MRKNTFRLSDIFNYRVEIFGFSALMIVYHHLGNRGIPGSTVMPSIIRDVLSFVLSKANIGVDIFVFLSAIGLYYSMSKNSIKDFYLHRFSRVFITWLVIMVPVFIYEDFILFRGGIIRFLLDVSTLSYWVDHANTNTPWFVPFIIVLYLIYPLLFKLDKQTKHISTIALLLADMVFVIVSSYYSNSFYNDFSFCFARLPIFLFGIIIANHIKKGLSLKKYVVIIYIICTVLFYVIWFFLDLPLGIDMLYGSVLAVGILLTYSHLRNYYQIKITTKLFLLFGTVSLEMYLVHTVILRVVDRNQLPDAVFATLYILLPLVSLLISKVYSIITKKLLLLFLKE